MIGVLKDRVVLKHTTVLGITTGFLSDTRPSATRPYPQCGESATSPISGTIGTDLWKALSGEIGPQGLGCTHHIV
jgi:hypothetical protein